MTATRRRESGAPDAPPGRRIPGEEGIWVFAVFFATFMYSRGKNPRHLAGDNASLNVAFGTVNTVLLLTSSLFLMRPHSGR